VKIATYNVNSVNARLPVLLHWLAESRPDVACLQELKAAQEKDNEISKAIPTTEALEKLVDTRITAALEPVVKAIEDLGIAHARLPRTLNPTVSLAPTQTDGAKERAAAVKTMSFGEALRYLVAN